MKLGIFIHVMVPIFGGFGRTNGDITGLNQDNSVTRRSNSTFETGNSAFYRDERGLIVIKKLKKRYPFEKMLKPGDRIEIYGMFSNNKIIHNPKIYIKDGRHTLFYLLFKPTEDMVIMNSKSKKETWHQRKTHSIRIDFPQTITNGERFNITIQCLENAFVVSVDNVLLGEPYPYRLELYRATDLVLGGKEIPATHFKWLAIKMPLQRPKLCPPGTFLTKSRENCLPITDAISYLKTKEFGNKTYRYRIVGNDTWQFYDISGKSLFAAKGPVEWTKANSSFEDIVLSAKPQIEKKVERSKMLTGGSQEEQGQPREVGIKGTPGSQGQPGEVGIKGTPGSQGQPGENDFCHLDYCLRGEKGEGGGNGLNGPKGTPGKVGDAGRQGVDGNTGEQGLRGRKGPKGEVGSLGTKGKPGIPGILGTERCGERTWCSLKFGKCYARSSSGVSVHCGQGYAAVSIWRNTRFWGLKCCEIITGSHEDEN